MPPGRCRVRSARPGHRRVRPRGCNLPDRDRSPIGRDRANRARSRDAANSGRRPARLPVPRSRPPCAPAPAGTRPAALREARGPWLRTCSFSPSCAVTNVFVAEFAIIPARSSATSAPRGGRGPGVYRLGTPIRQNPPVEPKIASPEPQDQPMTASTANLLEEAARLHRQGALGDAVSRYRQVLQSEPAHAAALYHLAVIECQQGRLAEGIELVQRSLESDPQQPRAHNVLGMALARLARHEEAIASFEHALVLEPDFADAHGNRASALMELGPDRGSGRGLRTRGRPAARFNRRLAQPGYCAASPRPSRGCNRQLRPGIGAARGHFRRPISIAAMCWPNSGGTRRRLQATTGRSPSIAAIWMRSTDAAGCSSSSAASRVRSPISRRYWRSRPLMPVRSSNWSMLRLLGRRSRKKGARAGRGRAALAAKETSAAKAFFVECIGTGNSLPTRSAFVLSCCGRCPNHGIVRRTWRCRQ